MGPPLVSLGYACGSPFAFYQKVLKVNMFLSVETNCFDARNAFRQFSESLEWFGGQSCSDGNLQGLFRS
jgi:hypothetical protein